MGLACETNKYQVLFIGGARASSRTSNRIRTMGIRVLVANVVVLFLLAPSASQETNTSFPITYRARAAEGGEQACSPDELRQRLQDITRNDVSNLLKNSLPALVTCSNTNLGQLEHCPAVSCRDIVRRDQSVLHPSGYYWIRISNGSTVRVYCGIDRACGCNSNGWWTRVAYLNMKDPNQQCPSAWTQRSSNSEPRRLCRMTRSGSGCESVTYSTFGMNYSHVCGRVIGYQHSTPDAFGHLASQTLEGYYVDGVSLTHGSPGSRQHIWTFAAGLVENNLSSYPADSCPCDDRATARSSVPSFVGNDYFCESGNPGPRYTHNRFYTNDPLWDGQGCGAASCCELSYPPGVTPPWFCKQLPQTTTDDIEVRICRDQTQYEGTPIELIEVYIQ